MKKQTPLIGTLGIALIQLFALVSCGGGDSGGASGRIVNVTGVTLDKRELHLGVDQQETLVAVVIPSNATNPAISWFSDDSSVARVTGGRVTGMGVGTARITATTENGGHKANCDVFVEKAAVTGVTLNKTAMTLIKGHTDVLLPTIAPANASNKNVSWFSTNSNVASVNSGGIVKAEGVGMAVIQVTTEDGGKIAACQVTVILEEEMIRVTGVALNKTTLALNAGATETLVPTIQPSNATNKNVTWSSSNGNIASVSSGGLVTGVAAGTAIITVTTQEGSKAATCNVTVAGGSGPSSGDVYVAGRQSVSNIIYNGQYHRAHRPRLWKNREPQDLAQKSPIHSGVANSVFISGSDVYVAGAETKGTGYDLIYTNPVLWKNGDIQYLTSNNDTYTNAANSVFVHGGNVYVAGVLNGNATLWKNGVSQRLSSSGGRANGVFVQGSDVYVVGQESNAPVLWKNGFSETLGRLPLTSYYDTANSVYVSGGDVYVAGQAYRMPVLWKNGSIQQLSTSSGNAYSVFVHGSDVYVAGRESDVAVLWKNGQKLVLGDSDSYAYSVFVK
jgi:uncharacterized protein YjdB